MIDDLVDMVRLSIFADDLDNAKQAAKDKNFGQVIIFGNRLLSDLTICWKEMTSTEQELVAVSGLIVRIGGINLNNLVSTDKQYPSVRLRNSAVVLFTSIKDALSRSDARPENLIDSFAEYCKAWSTEVNDVENTSYTPSKDFEKALIDWIKSSLRASSNLTTLSYSYPFHGISNEISRILFERRASRPLHEIYLLMSSLQWQHETSSRIALYLRQSTKETKDSEGFLNSLNSTKEFCERAILVIDDMSSSNMKKNFSYASLISDILKDWRNALNVFYQFNTTLPLVNPPKGAKEEKEEAEIGSK